MLKKAAFGTCYFERILPKREYFSSATKIINIHLDLEQALLLDLAINEAIRKINKYKKGSRMGRAAVVNLSIYFDLERIAVDERKLPKGCLKKKYGRAR